MAQCHHEVLIRGRQEGHSQRRRDDESRGPGDVL